MANTYAQLFCHIVFSTKNRATYLKPDIAPVVWEYLGGIARHHRATALQIGGFDDHVHALVLFPPSLSISELVKQLKGGSSHWISEHFSLPSFAWQDGYSAFSVSSGNVSSVLAYIRNQHEHHRSVDFATELIGMLDRAGIEYDRRYVFG